MLDSTTQNLHMTQLVFDSRRLMAQSRKHNLDPSCDLGYRVHCQLAALFGEVAPKPFSIRERGRRVEVLGYTQADATSLQDYAQTFAEPLALDTYTSLGGKSMPTDWAEGRRLGFEVRVCPVVRLNSAIAGHRAGAEVDLYERTCWQLDGEPEGGRERVYLDWLGGALERSGARLLWGRMTEFHCRDLFRRTQAKRRRGHRMQRPVALLQGDLEVVDGEAFNGLLARGIGRHRAFGFGMLLLRPPRAGS